MNWTGAGIGSSVLFASRPRSNKRALRPCGSGREGPVAEADGGAVVFCGRESSILPTPTYPDTPVNEAPDVILLRSADEPDPYVSAFWEAKLRAVCEPVLAFVFPHQAALQARLERRDRYGSLIATSPRAGTALERLFADREELAHAWRGTTVYVVGPKTAEHLRAVGLDPRGAETGDAQALANRIVEDDPAAPLLFLSGNRRRDTLPEALRAADVPFKERVVYETRPRSSLDLPSSDGSTWLVFFSPSGLEAVDRADAVDPADYRVAAIGPTTGTALEEAGHSVEAVAAEPSPDGLVAAITAADTGQ